MLDIGAMTPFASLPMWFDIIDRRSCEIHVAEDGCVVEMRALGQSSVSLPCATLSDAFEHAEMLRRLYAVEPSHIALEATLAQPTIAA